MLNSDYLNLNDYQNQIHDLVSNVSSLPQLVIQKENAFYVVETT